MTNHDELERWRLEALTDKLQRDLTHAEIMLKESQSGLEYLAERHDQLEALHEKLHRQNDQLRDIVRAAQYLIDVLHYQGNPTGGGIFSEAVDNLKAALRSWYEPNGAGR